MKRNSACAVRPFASLNLSACCVALAACGAPAATSADPATAGQQQPAGSASSSHVADFTLESIHGETVSLSDYAGKQVVLIDFWATWCEPCLAAMPHLSEMYEKHKGDGFVLLSVAMDGPDTVAEVRSYVQRHNLSFPVLLDQESRAVSLYNPRRSAPFSVLIGRDGTVLRKRDGYQPGDEIEIEKEVLDALATK